MVYRLNSKQRKYEYLKQDIIFLMYMIKTLLQS